MLRNTKFTYGPVSKLFHWVMALLVIGMLCLGFYMGTLHHINPEKVRLVGLHKSFGLTVFSLAVLRVAWRFMNPSPLLPTDMKWYEKAAARLGHLALYVLILAMPLTGWAMSSASGFTPSFFGLFTVPDIVHTHSHALAHQLGGVHKTLAWCLLTVLCLHALAALYHHFIRRDNVLRRMLPFTLLLAIVGGAATAHAQTAQAPQWKVTGGTVTFTATVNGGPVVGSFRQFTFDIRFDPANLTGSSAKVSIYPGKIDTPDPDLATTLYTAPWFDVKNFPKATYEVPSFSNTLNNKYVAQGQLTLKGVTRPVPLTFTFARVPNPQQPSAVTARLTGETSFSRKAFNIGTGEWASTGTVGDMVKITVNLNLQLAK